MVALNEQLQHCGVPISDGHMSLNVIDGCDFTKRSGEVHGGPVVNFGVSGFCGLSDASPLRPRCAAPLNKNDPETQLYYVRNRTYNPALGRWIQRDPIGHASGMNFYEYVGANSTITLDPTGLWRILRKGHTWAEAKPDRNKDPISELAKLAQMDPAEARKWMNPYEPTSSVKKGCPVKVPNTVYITRGDISIALWPGAPNPALVLNSVIIINGVNATLKSQGFHTVADWQVTSTGLQAYVDAPWTYGLVFVGHGDFGVGWLFATDKEVAWLLPYHRLRESPLALHLGGTNLIGAPGPVEIRRQLAWV